MRISHALSLVFTLFLTAGWCRLFPRLTPHPGTRSWDRAIIAFDLVVLLTAGAQIRADRAPEAMTTLFLGVVVTGLAVYAGWRHPQVRARRGD